MARVSEAEVKQIIETSLSDPIVLAFINTANRLVTKHLEGEDCHDADSLKDVELYLSAHFVALRQRKKTGQKIDDASDSYAGSFGRGLDFTQYGQTTKQFDCSGVLESLGQGRLVVGFFGGAGG